MSKLHSNYISIPYKEKPLNKIHTIENALSINDIQTFINSLNNKTLQDGLVGSKSMEHKIKQNIRMCKVFWLPKNKEYLWLYTKLIDIASKANRELWDFDLVGADIPIQYVEYDYSYKGHYDWHLDIGNTNNSKRKLSISIQLSDSNDYTGGSLVFFNNNKHTQASKKIGSMTLFPSYILHKVEPVITGKRRALILWLTGPPFK